MWTKEQIQETLHFITYQINLSNIDELQPVFLYLQSQKEASLETRFFYEFIILGLFMAKNSRMDILPPCFFDYSLDHDILEAYRKYYKDYHVRSFFHFHQKNIIAFYDDLSQIQDDIYQNRARLQFIIYNTSIKHMFGNSVAPPACSCIYPIVADIWEINKCLKDQIFTNIEHKLERFERLYGSYGKSFRDSVEQVVSFKKDPTPEKLEAFSFKTMVGLTSFCVVMNNCIYYDFLSVCMLKGLNDLCAVIESKIMPPEGTDELTVSYILPLWQHIRKVREYINTPQYIVYLEELFHTKSIYFNLNMFHDFILLKFTKHQKHKELCQIFQEYREMVLFAMKRNGFRIRLNLLYQFICAFIRDNRLHWIHYFHDMIEDFLSTPHTLLSSFEQKTFFNVLNIIEGFETDKEILEQHGFLITQEELSPDEKGEECIICFETTEFSVIECQKCHKIIGHFWCMHKWFRIHLSCPLCRS